MSRDNDPNFGCPLEGCHDPNHAHFFFKDDLDKIKEVLIKRGETRFTDEQIALAWETYSDLELSAGWIDVRSHSDQDIFELVVRYLPTNSPFKYKPKVDDGRLKI
jgi:hypothetical protein